MPTYKQSVVSYPNQTKRFLFVHIPRTAGRFLEENFLDNGFEPEQKIWDTLDGIEMWFSENFPPRRYKSSLKTLSEKSSHRLPFKKD